VWWGRKLGPGREWKGEEGREGRDTMVKPPEGKS